MRRRYVLLGSSNNEKWHVRERPIFKSKNHSVVFSEDWLTNIYIQREWGSEMELALTTSWIIKMAPNMHVITLGKEGMKQWVLTTEYATFVSYPVQKMCAMDGGDKSGTRLLI